MHSSWSLLHLFAPWGPSHNMCNKSSFQKNLPLPSPGQGCQNVPMAPCLSQNTTGFHGNSLLPNELRTCGSSLGLSPRKHMAHCPFHHLQIESLGGTGDGEPQASRILGHTLSFFCSFSFGPQMMDNYSPAFRLAARPPIIAHISCHSRRYQLFTMGVRKMGGGMENAKGGTWDWESHPRASVRLLYASWWWWQSAHNASKWGPLPHSDHPSWLHP